MPALSIARLLLGLILSANGFAMLAAPETWYATVPGVADTGPLNLHFVRDIGCAYLVSGGAFLWLLRTASAWPAALAGSVFLLLHGCVHLGEAAAGRAEWHHLLRDFPGVFLIPILALWLTWPRALSRKEKHDVTMDSAAPARRL
ncbi:hypothetical protein [Noviherbaspirillum autotrophicum]|uniref:hypothetical protein n=1 Tax=Noviherbaspirillum autotrophicum TaxID=709839 RepID=UPI0012FE10A3|nr:hypothetical protein [Noviherbaspirillum autotrophicum]